MALSRLVSHALRHEPWLYEIELDDDGWVPVDQLLDAIARRFPGPAPTRGELEPIVEHSDKVRHELRGAQIRALYGHSVSTLNDAPGKEPPALLFHGTTRDVFDQVLRDGLRPMLRRYVHLSADRDTAVAVGLRKDVEPQILVVRALEAFASGVEFYEGNHVVWLADFIPPGYIEHGRTNN